MAARKRPHAKKPHRPAAVRVSEPATQATLPAAALPRPDLTRWMAAGVAGVLAVAAFCQWAALAVLWAGGVSASLDWAGVSFPQEDSFWRLAEYENFAAAAKLAPPAVVAWASAIGPLLLLGLPWLAIRFPNPWVLGMSAGVAARLLAPVTYLLQVMMAWMRGESMPRLTSLEEYRLWILLGVPVGFSLLVQAVVVTAGWLRAMPRSGLAEHPVRLMALAAGACFGFGLLVLLRAS